MRYAVEYACRGYEERDEAFPLGVVAQDETGIHVKAVGADASRVAVACRLPESAIADWEEDARSRTLDPVWGPDGRPLDPRDPAWLTHFTAAGMEAKFFWGPVREVAGSGPEALEQAVAQARQDRSG